MVVITRKNLIRYCISAISCFLCIICIQMYNDKLKVQETISLPNTNKVIIIDAGHGKPDERCRK